MSIYSPEELPEPDIISNLEQGEDPDGWDEDEEWEPLEPEISNRRYYDVDYEGDG